MSVTQNAKLIRKDDITTPNKAKRAFLKAFGMATVYAAFAVGIGFSSPAFADDTVRAPKQTTIAKAPANTECKSSDISCQLKETEDVAKKIVEVKKEEDVARIAKEEAQKKYQEEAKKKAEACDGMKKLLGEMKTGCDKGNATDCKDYKESKPIYETECAPSLSKR